MRCAPGRATPAPNLDRKTAGPSHSPVPLAPQDTTPLWVWMRHGARSWRWNEGASLATIAARLGCSPGTVEQLLAERRL
jgi:hypothetical protein